MKYLLKFSLVFPFGSVGLYGRSPDAVGIVKLEGNKYKKIYMSTDKLI